MAGGVTFWHHHHDIGERVSGLMAIEWPMMISCVCVSIRTFVWTFRLDIRSNIRLHIRLDTRAFERSNVLTLGRLDAWKEDRTVTCGVLFGLASHDSWLMAHDNA